jgi:hypothetical protein
MATRIPVDCINKSNRADPHERITHVGGPNADGTRWKLTEAEAISGIEAGRWNLYVQRTSDTGVDVIVATRLGRKYLKTTADGERPDNLLSLRECG